MNIDFQKVSSISREYRVVVDGRSVGFVVSNSGKWWLTFDPSLSFSNLRFRTRKAAAEHLLERSSTRISGF